MESLLSGMLSKIGDQGVEKIAQSAGIDSSLATKILSQAGPLLTSKMADNARSKEGLASLNAALNNHDGSVFDHLDDIVDPNIDTKGSKILGLILGNNTGSLIEVLAKGNNTDSDSTQKILEMAAPLVLGQLGKEKKSRGLDAAGIFDLLQGEKKQLESSGNNILLSLGKQFLDKDKDGSIVDDVIDIAKGFLK